MLAVFYDALDGVDGVIFDVMLEDDGGVGLKILDDILKNLIGGDGCASVAGGDIPIEIGKATGGNLIC